MDLEEAREIVLKQALKVGGDRTSKRVTINVTKKLIQRHYQEYLELRKEERNLIGTSIIENSVESRREELSSGYWTPEAIIRYAERIKRGEDLVKERAKERRLLGRGG